MGSAFCQINLNCQKIAKDLANFCQNGKFLPNLVTLVLWPINRATSSMFSVHNEISSIFMSNFPCLIMNTNYEKHLAAKNGRKHNKARNESITEVGQN